MRFFSGRQVATMVVAICAAIVLVPTTVWAAGLTKVGLTDGHGQVARIDSHGRLVITDGRGNLTVNGTVHVTNGSDPLVVKGGVAARAATPSRPWNQVNDIDLNASESSDVLYSGSIGTHLNLTSYTAAVDGGVSGSVRIDLQVYVNGSKGGDCRTLSGDFSAAERFVIDVPAGQTVNLTYPSPLVYTNYGTKGHLYCVNVSAFGPSGYEAHISASGFLS